jgi:hypothetical protein
MASDDEVIGESMTAKMETYCRYYGDPNSETYGKKSASARAAGYQGKGAGCQLQANPRVRARVLKVIKEAFDESCLSGSKVLLDLERLRGLAEAKGDVSSAIRAVELIGKYFALFSERSILCQENQDEQPHLSEFKLEEARRIAEIRLREIG